MRNFVMIVLAVVFSFTFANDLLAQLPEGSHYWASFCLSETTRDNAYPTGGGSYATKCEKARQEFHWKIVKFSNGNEGMEVSDYSGDTDTESKYRWLGFWKEARHSNGFFRVRREDDRYNLVDIEGRYLLSRWADEISPMTQYGIFATRHGKKWQLRDVRGRVQKLVFDVPVYGPHARAGQTRRVEVRLNSGPVTIEDQEKLERHWPGDRSVLAQTFLPTNYGWIRFDIFELGSFVNFTYPSTEILIAEYNGGDVGEKPTGKNLAVWETNEGEIYLTKNQK